ncbi:MAG: DNA polymerase III subunit gamma/tau [Lachnospirales bacterium]
MTKQALYRKLRPSLWKDLVGQGLIVRTLQNQIQKDFISHAYLFSGTRGTGKTSTAKLFAKTVNCENKVKSELFFEPCNECDSCKQVNSNVSLDVIEIDAASNNGVDNIRDIINDVKYSTGGNKYKIYIIDEVHMLSIGAFNALLKTLEEPPKMVVFILATTDPQKIPQTILSRVQRFDFKRISEDDIENSLKKYSIQENINIEDEALKYIAVIADGAMRDALSILDQARAFYFDELITYENIINILGGIDKVILISFLEALLDRNVERVLLNISSLTSSGSDIIQVINTLLEFFRDLVSIKVCSDLFIGSATTKRLYTELCENIEKEEIMLYIEQFSKLLSEVKYSSNKKVLFELLCIKLCNPSLIEGSDALVSRIVALEDRQKEILEKGVIVSKEEVSYNKATNKPTDIDENSSAIKNSDNSDFISSDESLNKKLAFIRSNYVRFVSKIKGRLTGKLIEKSSIIIYKNNLTFVVQDTISRDVIQNNKDSILDALEKFFDEKVDFQVIIDVEINFKEKEVVKKERNFKEDIDFPIEEV